MTSTYSRQRLLSCLVAFCFFALLISDLRAQAPRIMITGRNMSFGTLKVGKDSARSFYIFNLDSNRGPIHAQIIGPATSNFALRTPAIFEVNPASVDTVTIAFTPQVEGSLSDSVFIAHDADTTRVHNPAIVRFSGTGLSQADTSPRISVSVPGLQITSPVDSVRTAKFIIRNVSDTVRYLVGSVQGIKSPFSLESGDTSFTLLTGDSAVYVVKFAPKAAVSYYDTLHIESNTDSLHQSIPVTLRGTGIDLHPAISLSSHYVDFGDMIAGTDSSIELILGNTGNSGTLYDTVIGPTSGPFSVTKGLGDSVRAPKQTMAIDIKFSPTAAGSFTDSLIIKTNAASVDQHIVVPLVGMAETPAAVAEEPIPAGFDITVRSFKVHITNLSGVAGAQASVYDEAGSCRISVPVNATPQTEIDLRTLPHGSYFVEVTAGNRSQIKHVVR